MAIRVEVVCILSSSLAHIVGAVCINTTFVFTSVYNKQEGKQEECVLFHHSLFFNADAFDTFSKTLIYLSANKELYSLDSLDPVIHSLQKSLVLAPIQYLSYCPGLLRLLQVWAASPSPGPGHGADESSPSRLYV